MIQGSVEYSHLNSQPREPVTLGQEARDLKQPFKTGGRRRSAQTMIRLIHSHLGLRGTRVGGPKPPPPTSPGTHSRVVNTVDGSIKWVKKSPKVPNVYMCYL